MEAVTSNFELGKFYSKDSLQNLVATLNSNQEKLKSLGLPALLYTQDTLLNLVMLPKEAQQKILTNINFRLRIYSNLEKYKSTDEKKLLKYALNKIGLTCPEDFCKTITRGDIIEVYSLSGVQEYANFEFFHQSSYTPLELALYQWDELFHRDPMVNKEIMSVIHQASNILTKSRSYELKPHVVTEKIGANAQFIINMGHIAPLFHKDYPEQRYGFVHSLKVKKLGSETNKRLVPLR